MSVIEPWDRRCVLDRVLDDDSAIAYDRGRLVFAEGTWEVTDRYDIVVGPYVIVPRVEATPIGGKVVA